MVLFPETGMICLLLWEKVLVQRFIILDLSMTFRSFQAKLQSETENFEIILEFFWSF